MVELLEDANELVSTIEIVKASLVTVFTNKQVVHEARWDHYMAWYALGGAVHTYTWYGWANIIPGVDNPIGYDCIVHCDRYQTIDLVESLSEIKDHLSSRITPCKLNTTILDLQEILMDAKISAVYWDW